MYITRPYGNLDFLYEDDWNIKEELSKWLHEEKDLAKQKRIYKVYYKYFHNLQKGQKVYEGNSKVPMVWEKRQSESEYYYSKM